MRVLVCGGRDYWDKDKVFSVLREIKPTAIIEGGCGGADHLAYKYWLTKCDLDKVKWLRFTAEWDRYGRSAGPRRNDRMLKEGKPDLIVAFPGGRGTADMVERARKAGVPVREISA